MKEKNINIILITPYILDFDCSILFSFLSPSGYLHENFTFSLCALVLAIMYFTFLPVRVITYQNHSKSFFSSLYRFENWKCFWRESFWKVSTKFQKQTLRTEHWWKLETNSTVYDFSAQNEHFYSINYTFYMKYYCIVNRHVHQFKYLFAFENHYSCDCHYLFFSLGSKIRIHIPSR